MQPKKTATANLEKKRITLFLLGLLAALGMILVFTELRSALVADLDLPVENEGMEEEETPEMIFDIPPPPPPPPPPAPTPDIKVVKNDVKIEQTKADPDPDPEEAAPPPPAPKVVAPKIDNEIYKVPDVPAAFPGGKEKMYDFLNKNIQFPAMARENRVKGRVYVNFVVEKDGSISNVKVLKGIGSGCDKEAMRVIKRMPKWKPAKKLGKTVRAYFTLPVKYTLKG